MYKFLLPLVVALITFASCTKNVENSCPALQVQVPDTQVAALTRYIDTNKIVAIKDPRGFYYSIADTGVGARPNQCSITTVNYTGQFTNGNVFETIHNVNFYLNGVISGWQVGLPLIKNGGIITLYLPPYLAYGQGSTTSIPANSTLIFTIQLVKVQ